MYGRRKVEPTKPASMRASTKTMIVGVLTVAGGIVGAHWKNHRGQEALPVPPPSTTIAPVFNNNINIGAGAKLSTPEPPSLPNRSRRGADEDNLEPRVSFISPPKGSKVKPVISVSGKVKGVPGAKHLWLVTRREAGGERLSRKQKVAPMADGTFEKTIREYGASGPLWVCVLMADPTETERFNKWQRVGDAKRDWPALSVGDTSTMLGCTPLKLDNPKYRSSPH